MSIRNFLRLLPGLPLLVVGCSGGGTVVERTSPPDTPDEARPATQDKSAPEVATPPLQSQRPPALKAGDPQPAIKPEGQHATAKWDPLMPASFDEIVDAQKLLVVKNPNSVREQRRLFMLYLLAEKYMEADEVLAKIKESDRDDLTTLASAHLAKTLGEHPEAEQALQKFLERWRTASGLTVDKCILCDEVRGYRLYTEYRSARVKPGSYVLVYIEPRGFEIRNIGGKSTIHLQYGWELIDDRDRPIRVDAWERARPSDREDRKEFSGEIREYHQKFLLLLPQNLAGGKYTIRVTVKDLFSGKSTTIDVTFDVAAI